MPNRSVMEVIRDRDFVTTTTEKSVHAVAAAMKSFGVTAVLVIDGQGGELVGICTERDLVFKVIAEGCDPNAITVGEIMTRDPMHVGPDRLFGHVLHLMHEGGFRHMPVVAPNGQPIGLISARDALGLEVLHFREEIELRENLSEIL